MRKLLLLAIIILALPLAFGQPSGSEVIYNQTETKTPAAADYLNTSGGTFTTIILSAETQNLKWKAYAGNVTGVLTLDDSGNYSIFQWNLPSITGEVYTSRNSSIAWSSISCASLSNVYSEEAIMNHTTAKPDSINNTFPFRIHRGFYVGNVRINESTCKSTFTWVNNSAQTPSVNAPFQEVLLFDGSTLVYSTFIDDNTLGFNNKTYDFQMIVAERGVGGYENTRYYFYMELE